MGGNIMTVNINIPETIIKVVANAEAEKQRGLWYDRVRKIVYGKQAVGQYFPDLSEEMAEMVNNSNQQIKVVPVRNNAGNKTGYYAIFNLCEIEGREWSDHIVLEIPEGKERLFSGANKWHLQEWRNTSWLRRLGVRRIVLK